MYFFWTFGGQVHGAEVDRTKPFDISWSSSSEYTKVFGIINDNNIVKVELSLDDGRVFSQTEFYDDDMFLFAWEGRSKIIGLKAYDVHGNMIFEDDRFR